MLTKIKQERPSTSALHNEGIVISILTTNDCLTMIFPLIKILILFKIIFNILGSLILTKNANILSHFDFNDGEINLVLFMKYFLKSYSQLSSIFQLSLHPKWIGITKNFHFYSIWQKKYKIPWIFKLNYVKNWDILFWHYYVK